MFEFVERAVASLDSSSASDSESEAESVVEGFTAGVRPRRFDFLGIGEGAL